MSETHEDHGYDIPLPEPADVESAEVGTLMVVYLTDDGAMAVPNVETAVVKDREGKSLLLKPSRRATRDDMWRMAVEVTKDVELAQTAERVGAVLVENAMAAQKRMSEAQINQQIAQQVSKSGLHVPGR